MLNPALLPGAPGTVRLVDLGDPGPPGDDFVRVRMLRAPINPADLLAIDGNYAFPLDPGQPLGAEGLGQVEAVGAAVHDLARGDAVLPLARGAWCAVRLVPRSQLIRLPAGLDPAQAAMLRINPATARLLLDALAVPPGGTIVQNAAASAVAAWVRAFAAAGGLRVVDVVRRADPALPAALLDGPDLAQRVRDAAGGPVGGALDCVAGDATGRLAAALAPGGRLLVFGHLSGAPLRVPSRLMTGGGLTITGFSLRPAETALGDAGVRALFGEILGMAAPAVPVRAVLPFARADEALALARAGGRGRVQLVSAISGM